MYVPIILGCMIVLPIVFPRLFWKQDERPKLLFYNIERSSENPYMENEKTSISIYDPDEKTFMHIDDVHDNASYEELCALVTKCMNRAKADVLYLITYDIDNKSQCLALILEDFLEAQNFSARFLDLKMLFYSLHDQVAKIVYKDLLEYYRITPLINNKPIEYAEIFGQLALDYSIEDDLGKLKPMFQRTCPIKSL